MEKNVKELVKQKYAEIALQDKETNESSCCGSGCCSTEVYNIMSDDYSTLPGNEIKNFRESLTGITSITVYGEKPVKESKSCCGPECCN